MPRPVHFEIHAEQPDRAAAFYTAVFSWQFSQWGGQDYWLIKTGEGEPGIDGGMVRRMGPPPIEGQAVNAYVCTIGTDDLAAVTAKVAAASGTVALPKMPIPGVGWLAYFKDTEGNIFGVMQNDPDAK